MSHNFLKEVARVFVDREGNIAYSPLPECQEILHSAIKRREQGFRRGTAQLVQQFLETHELYSDNDLIDLILGKPQTEMEFTAYCVKCKEAVTCNGKVKTSDSGRRMATGNCPDCGTKVNRILGKVDHDI